LCFISVSAARQVKKIREKIKNNKQKYEKDILNGKSNTKMSDSAASSEADTGGEDADVENCSKRKSVSSRQICEGNTAANDSDGQKITEKASSGVSDIDESKKGKSSKDAVQASKDSENNSSNIEEKSSNTVTMDKNKGTVESPLSDEVRLERELAKLEKMPKITVKLSRLTSDMLKNAENKPKTELLHEDLSQADAEKCSSKQPGVKRKLGESKLHVFIYDVCRAFE
jgi:hypothetical protein